MAGRREPGDLAGIEDALRLSDPRLAGMFSVFTRLAAGEDMPAAEQLQPPRAAAGLLALTVLLLTLLIEVAAGCWRTAGRGARLGCRACRRAARGTPAMPLQRDLP